MPKVLSFVQSLAHIQLANGKANKSLYIFVTLIFCGRAHLSTLEWVRYLSRSKVNVHEWTRRQEGPRLVLLLHMLVRKDISPNPMHIEMAISREAHDDIAVPFYLINLFQRNKEPRAAMEVPPCCYRYPP